MWLFSKLITKVPGLYALLTCSDKPVASFEAKRDFSLRSAAPIWFHVPLEGKGWSVPPDHLGWSASPPPGAVGGNSFWSFTTRLELIMGHWEVLWRGWTVLVP